MKKTAVALSLVALTTGVIFNTANACSRITLDTPYGVSQVRTLDWGQKLGTVAVVFPVGTKVMTKDVPSYQKAASWTVKYPTLNLEEREVFVDTTGEAINSEGLSASTLYMYDSQVFIKDYQDTGAPAVNWGDAAAFMAQNFKTVQEAVEAFEANEFQFAWVDGIHGVQHGLHISVQDKSGDIALFELNEGGEMVIHRGSVNDKLRVMANAPLQQYHDANAAKVGDMTILENGHKIGSTIASSERMLRGLYNTANVEFSEDATWAQTEGKLQSTFDAGNLVPQDVIDPTNDETYATWIQYTYNFENGSFKMRNLDTYSEIRIDLKQLNTISQVSCADLVEQAEVSGTATFTPCL
ncbi:linear amide C-N hydrolase [Vibrio hangzhouensis]|uniref:Choloylglycine hydrolase n=1 Tax=Vibrio hangzhouensis TaxID=462991 RepID=A0A1H5V878_9VIBR|nr:linear amide C-N hydrolase [Vibrio hangzhouensis]SEF83585.1 choloylglycine hydrolase [Vibrio hangzhouensis]